MSWKEFPRHCVECDDLLSRAREGTTAEEWVCMNTKCSRFGLIATVWIVLSSDLVN